MQTRENSEEPPEKITPGSPFDDPRADAIIRSSDNVDFKVHKLILSMASPVFSDMFLFPQMVQEDAELPVVTISEGSPVMDWVLRATYPTASTELNELDFIYQIVQAADKYQMDFLVDRLMSPLGKFVESDPLRVFAVACRFKHVSLARRAAHYTLRLLQKDIIQAYIPEFKFMPSNMLQYLLRYHEQCSNAAVALTKEFTWVREYSACWWQCRNGKPGPTQCKPCEAKAVVIPGTVGRTSPRQWFVDCMAEAGECLAKRPIGTAVAWKRIPKSVRDCPTCGPACLDDLMAFSKILAEKVDEVAGNVKLDLDFA